MDLKVHSRGHIPIAYDSWAQGRRMNLLFGESGVVFAFELVSRAVSAKKRAWPRSWNVRSILMQSSGMYFLGTYTKQG